MPCRVYPQGIGQVTQIRPRVVESREFGLLDSSPDSESPAGDEAEDCEAEISRCLKEPEAVLTAVWRRRLVGEGGSVISSGMEIGLNPCRFGCFIELELGCGCSDGWAGVAGSGLGLSGGDGVHRKAAEILGSRSMG